MHSDQFQDIIFVIQHSTGIIDDDLFIIFLAMLIGVTLPLCLVASRLGKLIKLLSKR